jgi:hypothetical protein
MDIRETNRRVIEQFRIEIGDRTYPAVAEVLTGTEGERVWQVLAEAYPFFAEHQKTSGRIIPVVALTRIPDAEWP